MKTIDPNEAVRLYLEGLTAAEVGARLGVSAQTVFRTLRRCGQPIRKRGFGSRPRQPMPLDHDRIRSMREDGRTTREIGEALGVSSECIRDRMIDLGIERLPACSRPGHNANWKGGRTQDKAGYVLVRCPGHPHANSAGYVREHRLVMESVLGRYLLPYEAVDHIDGNTSNNDPSNLRIFQSNGAHLAATLKGRCPKWTEDGKRRILEGCRRPRKKAAPIPEG